MQIPENIYYAPNHEWLRIEGHEAYVGISDYAQSELGEIIFVDITTQGQNLAMGQAFGAVEAVKTVEDIFMPVDGQVLQVNPELEAHPEYVNEDPYGQGWMIKIAMSNPSQVSQLMTAEQYRAKIGE